MTENYRLFYRAIGAIVPAERLIDDPMRTLAYGTDASFYRLIPKMIVRVENENEVTAVLKASDRFGIPVTFRAAGTSLSGQAVTDSVLIVAGNSWKNYRILENGRQIRLQPGIIGAQANRYLAPYGRKIGPDPASINAAMIGGIAANNASGMCCGTAQNSYQTIAGARLVLQDGTVLDTTDPVSRSNFKSTHGKLLADIQDLGIQVRENNTLAHRIRHKFRMKNTTGFSLNALVDYKDPFDIIEHLMIGSEGTLGFFSEILYDTVIEHPEKATSLMIFPEMESACSVAAILKNGPAYAVELMDRASLRSVEEKAGMPAYLKELPSSATALLVETRAGEPGELTENTHEIVRALKGIDTLRPIEFTDRVDEYSLLWNIRKGLFPAVGAVRRIGTTVVIEDVVFPMDRLATATLELQSIMEKHRYHEAIIFGHALEGNLHFVFPQDFATADEVDRYRGFMDEVCEMVVGRHDGSLKGEHGTGRNMAPFVEMEWGQDAYRVMKEIKGIFDPKNLLNPGVILNDNPQVHLEDLKPMPQTHPLVDKCVECGFCESICPSKNLTLTPRQRVVARREISRLGASGSDPKALRQMVESYVYQGEQTCAVDGLCGLSCPVELNIGELTKALRQTGLDGKKTQHRADWIAGHYQPVTRIVRESLRLADAVHGLVGTKALASLSGKLHGLSNNRLPQWNPSMPRAVPTNQRKQNRVLSDKKVVYFPSCISRVMGPAKGDPFQDPLPFTTADLLQKAGFEIIFPNHLASLCCGMPFESKGYKKQADTMAKALQEALIEASEDNRYPILFDTSPCLYRMKQMAGTRLKLYDPAAFIHDFLIGQTSFRQCPDTIAVHVPCSAQKMGLADKFRIVAQTLAAEVVIPEDIHCCGFAGDRGFNFPELNASALKELKPAVSGKCSAGYSSSRTCEIGLSLHSGMYYRSIIYLADRCIRGQSA